MRRSGATPLVLTLLIAVGWLTYTLTLGGHTPQLGLDLQGGTSVVLGVKAGQTATSAQLDQSISIIRRRVDGLGVAEPEITRQGKFIVVSLPGVKDSQQAIELVGRTAKLQFRPTCTNLPTNLPDSTYTQSLDPAFGGLCVKPTDTGPAESATTTTATTATTAPTAPTAQSSMGARPAGHLSATQTPTSDTTTSVPAATDTTAPGDATTTTAAANPLACGTAGEQASVTQDGQPIVAKEDRDKDGTTDVCSVLGPTALSGEAVSSARAAIPQGSWVVELELKGSGLDGFNQLSGHCFAKDSTCPAGTTAIVLDGNVESNPAPQTATFTSTSIEISGKFNQKQAEELALVLNYGALPIQLQQERVETVSATLGHDSLRAGLIAGMVGIGAVAIYMILYYRALGVVVIVGLGVWSALSYSIITALSSSSGLALSLSGVTGIVVSVGVTTDSYIVYFERMKDEIKTGKTVRSAVDHAFKRAWRTIVSADLASFIGAALLFWLTVGAVRGFAFFLGLSTLLDLITAYFFKRPMVALLARSRFLTEARWIGIRSGLGDAEHRVAAPVVGGR
ncbi:MAG: preprotein translocase subunit SecD [Acidimicrobiaceae bacterium]|jgi:preprotein translocase subunit SecD